jgi:hypothetical protein
MDPGGHLGLPRLPEQENHPFLIPLHRVDTAREVGDGEDDHRCAAQADPFEQLPHSLLPGPLIRSSISSESLGITIVVFSLMIFSYDSSVRRNL